MSNIQIAQTILSQIKALTPWNVLGSWGASAFVAVSENQIKGLEHNYAGGLMFYVRGRKHTGHVMISLAGNDTYVVSIGHCRTGEFKMKKQMTDVYAEMLPEVIDSLVETEEKQGN